MRQPHRSGKQMSTLDYTKSSTRSTNERSSIQTTSSKRCRLRLTRRLLGGQKLDSRDSRSILKSPIGILTDKPPESVSFMGGEMLNLPPGWVFVGADSRKRSDSSHRSAVENFLLSSTRCRGLEHPELECRYFWMLFHAQGIYPLHNAFWTHSAFEVEAQY